MPTSPPSWRASGRPRWRNARFTGAPPAGAPRGTPPGPPTICAATWIGFPTEPTPSGPVDGCRTTTSLEGGGMRNGCLIFLSTVGLLGCAGKHLLVGEDGAGGVGAAAGAPGSPSGTAGAGATGNAAGSGGPGATTGLGGAVIQPVDAGTAVG